MSSGNRAVEILIETVNARHTPEPVYGPSLVELAEVLTVAPTGAMRMNGAKSLMYLVPPEVLEEALPGHVRHLVQSFIDWFHNERPCSGIAEGAQDALTLAGGVQCDGVLAYAEVLTKGAQKYAPRNWELGLPFSNLYNSAIRHALKASKEEIDADTGCTHWACYAWNVCACYVFTLRGRTDLDDRLKVLSVPMPEGPKT